MYRNVRRYYFPAVLVSLIFSLLVPTSSQAASDKRSAYRQGKIHSASVVHPTPKRVYLVTRDATRIPSKAKRKAGARIKFTGLYTVTFSDMSVFRFAVCGYQKGPDCIWPAKIESDDLGFSYVSFRGRVHDFPDKMIRPAYPLI